ncbi:GNAT family N-acetyltransferase [Pseudonocardia phyllosphaerae]|uniref:GNAT family N-acetyltransferase n=1 Tax=Pseudonocardia phyllosphaerae TaxID=3390502 RepID=UPI00397A402F
MPPRIRRRIPTDLPACVDVLADVHATDRYPAFWPSEPASWLSPDDLVDAWVASVDDGIAGHVALTGSDLVIDGWAPDALVSRLFVAPDRRRDSVGSLLLAHVRDHARRTGRTLGLEVAELGARPAVALYEQRGWTCVGTGVAGWRTPDGDPVLVRYYRS